MIGEIEVKGKRVVIIGTGQQACEKGKHMEEAGAEVCYVQKAYEPTDIAGAFLVYACTDDSSLNHQIVLDANANQSLSASVHQDDSASFHALRSEDFGLLRVAVSTKGAYPSFGQMVIEELRARYTDSYASRLLILQPFRAKILQLYAQKKESDIDENIDINIEKRQILSDLAYASAEELDFYECAMRHNKALICVFRGDERDTPHDCIQSFLKRFTRNVTKEAMLPIWFVHRHECVREAYNEQYPDLRMLSPEQMKHNLYCLEVTTVQYEEASYFQI
ncbi:MAG: NAD(P)-dependent oxidoreductase [Lachnospiraceae bacterium]